MSICDDCELKTQIDNMKEELAEKDVEIARLEASARACHGCEEKYEEKIAEKDAEIKRLKSKIETYDFKHVIRTYQKQLKEIKRLEDENGNFKKMHWVCEICGNNEVKKPEAKA